MKQWKYLIILFLFFPIQILAYSNHLIVGGETIGIEVHSAGVYIVGYYDIPEGNQKENFQLGDRITRVNDQKITNISSLQNIITKEGEYSCQIKRNGQVLNKTLRVVFDQGILKTGLYVKDQINGIGTLSYIDPETRIFGSLGHEILESSNYSKFEIIDGKIYSAQVTDIRKSTNSNAGEKKASYNREETIGTIYDNDTTGIYGIYDANIKEKEELEVGNSSEIKKGKAQIRTVIDKNKVEEFEINIINITEEGTKNIYFEITDNKLLNKTGGIVQGMSGSPIIQNHKIIGVVNYVLVDDVDKGYGIFITKMLEEGDQIRQNS